MQIGEHVGPYKLIKQLGKGGFGVVWLAERSTAIAVTKVALKIPIANASDLEVIKREAALWVQASGHPNILPIIEANIYQGQPIIVSEYAPDGSLSSWLNKFAGAVPLEPTLEMIINILSGLEHLHERQIVHRDLKPDNILLQGEVPRLADFGIARALRSQLHSFMVRGTPSYMAPETFDGVHNEQTDLWAVGVILYRMLTGHLPFPQKSLVPLMEAIMESKPLPLPEHIPSVVQEVVDRALAKSPSERFNSAAEMRVALIKIVRRYCQESFFWEATSPYMHEYCSPVKLPIVDNRELVAVAQTDALTEEHIHDINLKNSLTERITLVNRNRSTNKNRSAKNRVKSILNDKDGSKVVPGTQPFSFDLSFSDGKVLDGSIEPTVQQFSQTLHLAATAPLLLSNEAAYLTKLLDESKQHMVLSWGQIIRIKNVVVEHSVQALAIFGSSIFFSSKFFFKLAIFSSLLLMAIILPKRVDLSGARQSLSRLSSYTATYTGWNRPSSEVQITLLPDRFETEQLIKLTIVDLDKMIGRVECEMAPADLSREDHLTRFKAFKQVLENYTQGSVDLLEARNYAESARSQLNILQHQLDQKSDQNSHSVKISQEKR